MVMRQNAMGVNLRRTILKSLGRYIAIMLIIALGSSLFVGLLMTKTDMVLTGGDYMRQQNFFDLRFISTYGWTQEQVDAANQLPGVESAEGVLYLDLIASDGAGNEDCVFRFHTLSDTMNRFSLRGGRMPEAANECLADGYVYDDSILGATVTVSDRNDADSLEDVACRSFTVVGYGGNPMYMDMNRGTTSVGSGVLKAFFYVPQEAFSADYYSEIHLTLPEEHPVYSESYNAYLDQMTDELEPEAERLGQMRFEDIKAEAEAEYQDGYQEYLDGVQEYEDGKLEFQQELEDAWKELKDGEAELIRGTRDLKEAEKTLAETEAALDSGFAKLEQGRKTLDQQKAQTEAALPGLKQQAESAMGYADSLGGSLGLSSPDAAQAEIGQLMQTDPENPRIASLTGYLEAYKGAMTAQAYYQGAQKALDQDIPAGYQQLEANRLKLVDGWEKLEDGWAEVRKGWEELKQAQADLQQGFLDYEEGKLEGEQELADAEIELKDAEADLKQAREDIDAMEPPDVFVLDRTSNVGYSSLDSTSDIVASVSRILPVFFLLVASLVCITTMTRMIEEERTQIGTLKALGYSNASIISKYMVYAGSGALIGCGLGVVAGSVILPQILWDAYQIMLYIREDVMITFNWWLCGIVVGVYTAVILFVTWYCCRKALMEQPAELIRPKAPDPGKKLLVERLALWNKVSFLNKVMVRNIFRYRQRLAMMLVGIGGCTALLVTGFGLQDSILGVVDYQFANVSLYDMEVYFAHHQTPRERSEFLELLEDRTENVMFFHQSSTEITFDDITKEIYLVSGEEGIGDFWKMQMDGNPVSLPGENEIVLSVGVAEALAVRVGDRVTLRNADFQTVTLTVCGIYKNHVYNYGFVSPKTLAENWGEEPEQQMAYLRVAPGQEVHAVAADISEMDGVLNVTVSQDVASLVNRMMEALDLVVLVVVFCAGLLAAIVLYNLTNININERVREIATIKVLGFNARETAAYVFKENLTLTIVGAFFGLGLGELLLYFVMAQVKIDMVWFNTIIEPMSYVISFALTVLAAFLVNFVFYFKLDGINMAEALKSVE